MIVKFLRGEPITIHVAAPSAVVPGQIVAIGNTPVIAINRAASGDVAAFAVGGGVYQMTASEVSGEEPTAGNPCYLDGEVVADDTAGGKHLGICVAVTDDVCQVVHNPNGTTLTP